MSRKFVGLMAVAGLALAAGMGGAAQDARAGLFSGLFGHGGHGGSCGYDACGYGACDYGSCGYVSHGGYEYDDDDACGWRGHRGHGYHGCGHVHHNHGCYSSCGPVYSAPVQYSAPVSSCGSCATTTCCSAPVSHCGSSCGTSHCGHVSSGCSSCGTSSCGSACGGYATSVNYGGCSACGTTAISGGCVGGACGVTYGTSPMQIQGGAIQNQYQGPSPAQSAEEAPAPPAEDDLPPAA